MGWFCSPLQSSRLGACEPPTPWRSDPLPGAFSLRGLSLHPLPPSRLLCTPAPSSGPLGGPCLCLTGVGVPHHGGQVAALVYVHGHEGCVFADDVAGLAGVHGIRLVAAAGPCRGRSRGHCAHSERPPSTGG